jgi:class 3 adenylate cyclase
MAMRPDRPFAHVSLAWESAWREHLAQLTQSRLFIAAVLIAGVVLLDAVFQYFFRPTMFAAVFWARAAVIAVAGLVAIGARMSTPRHAVWLALALCVALAGDIEAAALQLGGPESPFQAGLALLLVGAGLIVPFSVAVTAVLAAIVWVLWLTPIAVAHFSFDWVNIEIPVLLLLSATAIALTASYVTGRLRRSEFFGRLALAAERERSERLLLNVLPAPIAERLKGGAEIIADEFKETTVLFADIVGFTSLASRLSAGQVVALLNEIFSSFDDLAARYRLEKIKTIGDAYMVAAGVPEERTDHAHAVADFALAMRETMAQLREKHGIGVEVRIGLHCGPVVAGVIGRQKFIYDVWGDTVNTASRMESHGVAGKIQVSADLASRLGADFEFESRDVIEVKGKGLMQTFFLLRRRQPIPSTSNRMDLAGG